MIIKAFSEYLKNDRSEEQPVVLLHVWLKEILSKEPSNNIETVIHTEIDIFTDSNGLISFKGKSKSGEILLKSLHNFALSFDQYKFSKWLHNIKASDFKNIK